MAIQINEKNLSPKAKQALNNAKNKSQFLRDAIEFYVNKEIPEITIESGFKADIKEIKELLMKMSLQTTVNETAITTETFSTSQNIDKSNENFSLLEDKKEIQEVEKLEDVKKEIQNTNIKNNNLSEKEKEEIEKMLDSSLDGFF